MTKPETPMTIIDRIKDLIKELVEQPLPSDDFEVHEYSGSNVDDAYYLGRDHGQEFLARIISEIIAKGENS